MNKIIKLIVLFSVTSLMINCQSKIEEKIVFRDKPLSCVQQNDYTIDSSFEVQHKNVMFYKTEQRVQRVDCNDKLISDKLEISKMQKLHFDLKPVKKLNISDSKMRKKTLDRINGKAFNRQTCSESRLDILETLFTFPLKIFSAIYESIVVPVRPRIEMTLDYGPTIFTTEVDEGIQLIDYKFTTICEKAYDNIKENSSVKKANVKVDDLCQEVFEEGTVILNVQYKVEHLKEVLKIKECASQI